MITIFEDVFEDVDEQAKLKGFIQTKKITIYEPEDNGNINQCKIPTTTEYIEPPILMYEVLDEENYYKDPETGEIIKIMKPIKAIKCPIEVYEFFKEAIGSDKE